MQRLPITSAAYSGSLVCRQIFNGRAGLFACTMLVMASLLAPDLALAERYKCKSAKGRYVFRDAPCGTPAKKPSEKAAAVVASGATQRTRGSRNVRNRHLSDRHERVKRLSKGASNSTAIGRSASNRYTGDE